MVWAKLQNGSCQHFDGHGRWTLGFAASRRVVGGMGMSGLVAADGRSLGRGACGWWLVGGWTTIGEWLCGGRISDDDSGMNVLAWAAEW